LAFKVQGLGSGVEGLGVKLQGDGRPQAERAYRGTSLVRNRHPVGPYSRTMPRLLWWPRGGGAVSYERGTPVGVDRAAWDLTRFVGSNTFRRARFSGAR